MEGYRKFRNGLCTVLQWFMAACLFVLVVLALLQVITRYFIAVTVVWVEELSIYIMGWMAAAGVSWLWLDSNHIRMDMLNGLVSKRFIHILDIITDVFIAALGFSAVRIGLRAREVNLGYMMSVINLDEGDRFIPLIVGGALLCFSGFYMIVEHVWQLRHSGEEEEEKK